MANNKGTITAKETFDGVYEEADKINKKFLELLETFNKLSKTASTIKTPVQATAVIEQNKTAYNQTNIALKERENLMKRLVVQEERNKQATSDVSKNLAKQRYETQQLNKANKQNAILTSSYADSYDKLATRLALAKKNLKNLTIEQGANATVTKKAAVEYQKLNEKVRLADAAAGDFQRNVGNYPKALSGAVGFIKQLVGAFGAVEAIRLGARLIKDSIELAREAKGVEFAFERLGQVGVNAFENVRTSTRGLLSELDIKKALVDFDNFNISLEETDTLFEFLSVRAAQTGKSMDYLRDSLVEGLSKESKLRIDNLGISAEELNKELEKTPNFVQAVANIAKREVAEAGDILDEAANSGTKFNASLQNISLNWGKAFAQVKGSSFVNDLLDKYNSGVENLNYAIENNIGLIETLKMNYRNFTKEGREENERIKEETRLRIENNKAIDERNKKLSSVLSGNYEESDPFSLYFNPDRKKTLNDINEELEVYNKQLSEGLFSTRAEAKVIQDKIAALEKEKEAILGVRNAKNNVSKAIEGTIAWYKQEIAAQIEFQENTAKTAEEIRESNEIVNDYQKSIDALIGSFEKLQKIDVKVFGLDDTGSPEERFKEFLKPFEGIFDTSLPEEILKATSENALKELVKDVELYKSTEERKTQISKEEAEKRGEIFKTLFGSFANIYGLDLTLFEKMVSKEKATMEDYANFGISTVGAFYDGKFANYEEDQARNQATLNAILNDSQASDKKKEQAQIEYDKKERKLQQQKAKAAKDEALFQIAISTAVAVVKSLPNYAQAIAVAALGGIQAGIVASRKIPQFFKGTDYAPRGWAWTDEKGAEIHTDRRGKIKDFGSNDGPRLKFLESGDKIFTAEKSKQLFNTEIFNSTDNIKHLIAQRLASDTNQRAAMFAVNSGVDSKEIGRAVERAISKYANRPLNINNNVIYSKPRTRY